MRIAIATDAWSPQVNGVVRTLETVAGELRGMGCEVDFVEDLMKSGFTIYNPNAVSSCACGSSFQAKEGVEGGPDGNAVDPGAGAGLDAGRRGGRCRRPPGGPGSL